MERLLPAILIMAAACSKPPAPAAVPDEAGFERLGPPKPGEWRHSFPEDPQTVEDYVAACANRKTAGRGVFYIQPLGGASTRYRETIDRMRAYAEAFFGVPARVCEPIPMFENGWVPVRRQYNASMLIGQLADRVPADALVYVGITEKDLFAKGLNFVFGEGNLANRCGVYSLSRYETDDAALFLRRSLKLLSHEAGHILSIHHCTTFRCVMQGANSLREDDGHPMHLCPIDLRKLQWNTGFDVKERYRRLLEFYTGAGLGPEADWVSGRVG